MSHIEERLSGLASVASHADRWREAARLRAEFPGWIVIWLAPAGEFRAYRRLPGSRRDATLTAATPDGMSAAIQQAVPCGHL